MSFTNKSYEMQSSHFSIRENELHERFNLDSIDRWRHGRMYDCVTPLINSNDSWVTIGDGRYGSDAFFLKQRGVHRILPTDLSETLLRIGKEKSIIDDYQIENAEHLSFGDSTFDWAFCKEAYHHFPRPMIAVYEMLRVAKEGIVLIEPNDGVIETRHLASVKNGWQVWKRSSINLAKRKFKKPLYYPFGGYEESGNYIYTISRREIEKVALGLDLPWVAFKGLNDIYKKGYETELAQEKNPVFQDLKNKISEADKRVSQGKSQFCLLAAIIGKRQLPPQTKEALEKTGFTVLQLPRNPYVRV